MAFASRGIIHHKMGRWLDAAIDDSPTETRAQESACSTFLDFTGDDAHKLADHMVSESFSMTTTSDGPPRRPPDPLPQLAPAL